ncbi:hypothetical protein [Sanguibacter sp. 25GB23B1]|uniref:carboxylate--amine ligase n=1 Tax=Sanguibacter sp. 25GB23B1 TaxID=3156067 RepID=UPI0032AEC8EA
MTQSAQPQDASTSTVATQDILPVILGADIGVYALARAFHEAYGVRSIVISGAAVGAVADSSIIDNSLVDDSHDPQQLVDRALQVAAQNPGRRLVLLANSDWLVRVIVQHRVELEQHFVVPFLSEELLDRISDKATFSEICDELGISVPRTIVQDFAGAAEPGWAPVPVDVGFPLIAKAASSADYQDVEFEGKKKVFEIETQTELDELWVSLQAAGYRGRFVVQELIPGDDTQMRSITSYTDSRGEITLLCSAHVLLEEHTPSGLGNPAAMITRRFDDMLEQARQFLVATGYVGFANFDVKVDPRDGSFRFFEVNPRIGRNNYYLTAAGANPMTFLVEDRVHGRAVEPVVVDTEILYSILPNRLLLRYVVDPALRATVTGLMKSGKVVHPLRYSEDASMKRRTYVQLALLNQVRKFRTYYPRLTSTGF